ncbi:MAG: hypothetical protein AB7O26_05475 [Planctomycetaceae bacterium]
MPFLRSCLKPLLPAAAIVVAVAASLSAGNVTVKNGMTFEGTPNFVQGLSLNAAKLRGKDEIVAFPTLMIDDGMRRTFVSRRQVAVLNREAQLSKYESFDVKQIRTSRKPMLGSLEGYAETTPFNEFGQRTHVVNTQFGPKSLTVGVTKITPQILSLTGLNYDWDHAIATTSMPPETLDAILRKACDPKNPDDRMGIARLYLQAGLYPQCAAELDAVAAEFPERKETVALVRQNLRELQATLILQELRNRKLAGQHNLAVNAAETFPTKDMSASVLREIRELKSDYDNAKQKAEKALQLLGELQGQLTDSAVIRELMPLRSTVSDELNYETIARLEPFLNLASDSSLPPSEKLSLAYSGWILGSANAITDLNAALSLWKARQQVAQYLQSDNPQDRADLLAKLQSLEGISVERVAQIIQNIPPTVDTPDIKPMLPHKVEVADRLSDPPPAYHVLLPEEYSPHHRYPLIVALRTAERPASDELLWWSGTAEKPGQATRHGYIVIAPEYLPENVRHYDYSSSAHDIVLRSITDARKRFRIDSDRIYLSGHGAGGDAAFDIGMSHPDLFAGVIPIAAVCDQYCRWYYPNARQTAFYVVGGELDLDRNTTYHDTTVVDKMMVQGLDITYVEYIGRGYESYYEEVHRIFEWMELHRRQKYLKSFDLKVLRTTENRCQWLRAEGFPPTVTAANVLSGKSRGRVTPMTLSAEVAPGKNLVTISSGAKSHSLWFSPEFVSFDERLVVKKKGDNRQHFNDFLKPSIATLLEDLRIRGDREMTFTARVDVE